MNLQSIKQRFNIIGRSEDLDRALGTASRVAATDLTVLITGESGVGKEVFSQVIHALSPRKHNAFIAVNCGAIPEGTINSELFGHEKGAFTGATSDRKGYFETANGGTIFLDEVGEMPLDTQAFLLRVLESGEYIKVGSSKIHKTDVRVVAATNVDLKERVKAGKFREDLYYRLNIVPIHVPSLKERKEDIYTLFRKFVVDFADKYHTDPIQIDDAARQLLVNYHWPGNIRELKNVAEQLSVISDESVITAEALIDVLPNIRERYLPAKTSDQSGESIPERELLYKLLFDMKGDLNDLKSLVFELIKTNDLSVPDIKKLSTAESSTTFPSQWEHPQPYGPAPANDQPASNQPIVLSTGEGAPYAEEVEENLSLEAMERDLIQKVLTKHKGRRKDAAEELGISERTLYRKIKLYDI